VPASVDGDAIPGADGVFDGEFSVASQKYRCQNRLVEGEGYG
jgi:hypothetical protein